MTCFVARTQLSLQILVSARDLIALRYFVLLYSNVADLHCTRFVTGNWGLFLVLNEVLQCANEEKRRRFFATSYETQFFY